MSLANVSLPDGEDARIYWVICDFYPGRIFMHALRGSAAGFPRLPRAGANIGYDRFPRAIKNGAGVSPVFQLMKNC